MNRSRSAHARRLYLHHKGGGRLTDNDMSHLVAFIEELEGMVDAKESVIKGLEAELMQHFP